MIRRALAVGLIVTAIAFAVIWFPWAWGFGGWNPFSVVQSFADWSGGMLSAVGGFVVFALFFGAERLWRAED